jgi:hypothetical protein
MIHLSENDEQEILIFAGKSLSSDCPFKVVHNLLDRGEIETCHR